MANMPWFRIYSEILDDKKIKRITRHSACSKAEIIGVWVCLLSLANDATDRGKLMISDDTYYDIDDIEEITGVHQSKLEELLMLFVSLGMLSEIGNGYEITNWNTRQFKSDNSTERVKNFRSKNIETLQQRYKTVIDTDTDTDTEEETEQDSQPAVVVDKLYTTYESEFGALIPIVAEKIADLGDLYPENWILEAMRLAVQQNVRKISYVEAILKRWKTEGKGGVKKPKPERSREDLKRAWGAVQA